MQKKAAKKNIKEVAWLHVDIDPANGKSLLEERSRIEALLTTDLPAGVPKPTAVIDSGGGYWGFWRLAQPIEINGDLPKAKEAALYNKKLEEIFGADHCHSIDHLTRLPGTVNWPDQKKRDKGREPALSCVIEEASDWSASYSIDNFDRSTNPNTAVDTWATNPCHLPAFAPHGRDPTKQVASRHHQGCTTFPLTLTVPVHTRGM